jgi:hypothetical protein
MDGIGTKALHQAVHKDAARRGGGDRKSQCDRAAG